MIRRSLAAVRSLVIRRGWFSLALLPPVNEVREGYVARGGALVHETAVVARDAQLGAGVVIGPFAVVEGGTRIGDATQIGAHCVIKRFTSLGSGNRVHPQAVLGAEPQDVGFGGEESFLVVGNDNVVRESVIVQRASGSGGLTRIGNANYLMGGVQISHDCQIGHRAGVASNTVLAGHVRIEDEAFVSGQVAIAERCRIGRGALVGGSSALSQDILPFCVASGFPARLIGLNGKWLRRSGVAPDQVTRLKRAFHLLSARGRSLEDSLDELSRLRDPLIDELVAFVRGSSRGFCRARR